MGRLTDSLKRTIQKSDERVAKLNAEADKAVREFEISLLQIGYDPNTGKKL